MHAKPVASGVIICYCRRLEHEQTPDSSGYKQTTMAKACTRTGTQNHTSWLITLVLQHTCVALQKHEWTHKIHKNKQLAVRLTALPVYTARKKTELTNDVSLEPVYKHLEYEGHRHAIVTSKTWERRKVGRLKQKNLCFLKRVSMLRCWSVHSLLEVILERSNSLPLSVLPSKAAPTASLLELERRLISTLVEERSATTLPTLVWSFNQKK